MPPIGLDRVEKAILPKKERFLYCNPLTQVIVYYCHLKVDFIVEKKD